MARWILVLLIELAIFLLAGLAVRLVRHQSPARTARTLRRRRIILLAGSILFGAAVTGAAVGFVIQGSVARDVQAGIVDGILAAIVLTAYWFVVFPRRGH